MLHHRLDLRGADRGPLWAAVHCAQLSVQGRAVRAGRGAGNGVGNGVGARAGNEGGTKRGRPDRGVSTATSASPAEHT